MSGQPDSEQLQNFNERLSQWVASQGFWFQLRYSLSGGGAKGAVTFHALKLAARLGIFLLIVAVGGWVLMINRTGSGGYREDLTESLKQSLAAEAIELRGFSIRQGEFNIGQMALIGGEETFFSGMELRNIKARKELLDDFRSEWDPGLVEISRADVDLRAGADSKESANAIGDVLLQKSDDVKLDAIRVVDTTLRWGYSSRTRGAINGSRMRAQRVPEGWRVRFTGGTFSQNWLKRLEIVELVIGFRREGIVFEKAIFKKGRGQVIFEDLRIESGERPEVSGTMKLRDMDLSLLVPAAVRNFVEGNISGDFRVFGSINSSDGVGFEGKVELGDDELVVIQDRLHLLRALSVVDAFNNYRRLNLREGSFHMRSHGGTLELSDVDLRADEHVTLKGEMKVRPPTSEEAQKLSEFGKAGGAAAGILSSEEIEAEGEISLSRAAQGAGSGTDFEGTGVESNSLFDQLGVNMETRRLDEQTHERLVRALRYEGRFTVTLPKEAFTRAPQLAELYPGEEGTGRVSMEVPLQGVLYELTQEQAEEIYEKGAR